MKKSTKTIDDFDSIYTPDSSITSTEFDDESQVGMLETFGEDFKQVLEVNKKNPLRVWTAVDCETGMFLIQGLHMVNRVYYIITNEPAKSKNEEYLIDEYEKTN